MLCKDTVIVNRRTPLVQSTKWVAGNCAEYEVCAEHNRRRKDKYRVATCVGFETFTDMAMRAEHLNATGEREDSAHGNSEAVKRSPVRSEPAKLVHSSMLNKRTPFRRLPDCSRFGAHYYIYASRCQTKPSSNAYKVICASITAGARSIRGECDNDEICFQFSRTIARCVSKEWLRNASKEAKEGGQDDRRSKTKTVDHERNMKTMLGRRQLTKVSPARVRRKITFEVKQAVHVSGINALSQPEKRGKASKPCLQKRIPSRLMKECSGFTGPQYFSSSCLGRSSPQAYYVYCVRIGAASAEQVPSAYHRGECDETEICVEQAKNEASIHLSRAYCVSKYNFVSLIRKGLKKGPRSLASIPSSRGFDSTADSPQSTLAKRYPPEHLNHCSNYSGYLHYETWCAPHLSRKAYRIYCYQPAEEDGYILWQHNMGNCREDEFCVERTSKGPIIVTKAYCVSNKNLVDLAMETTRRLKVMNPYPVMQSKLA